MKKVKQLNVLFSFFVTVLCALALSKMSLAFSVENQSVEEEGMVNYLPACSSSFVKTLNKNNTIIWVNDPHFPGQHVPCCIRGMVCQPYPAYQQYVVAQPLLQSEYDCARIAEKCGYTPICQVKVGEALDPTTVCTGCVPYRFTFWATVYQNRN